MVTLQLVKDHFFFVLLTNSACILIWHLLVESFRQKYEGPCFTWLLLAWLKEEWKKKTCKSTGKEGKQLSLPKQSWEQKLKRIKDKQLAFKFPYSVEDVLYKKLWSIPLLILDSSYCHKKNKCWEIQYSGDISVEW